MFALIRFFVGLCLLRRTPQELPASHWLFAVLLAASVVAGWLGTVKIFGDAMLALQANLIDAGLVLLLLRGTLQLAGHPARFLQTGTAFFGVSALFSAALVAAESLIGLLDLELLMALAQLIALAWIHVVLGHVLRHAIDKDLWVGILIAMGYTFVAINIVFQIVPPGTLESP